MLCIARIERVSRQLVFALLQVESARWNNDMNVAGFRADRAITLLYIKRIGQLHREPHRPAMAASQIGLMRHH